MSSNRDEGPVYYREIQKNAYLKRVPADHASSKLRPLGHKKPPLKPMWTLFCVHNGRTPYLEQYPDRDHATTLTHCPAWRACLKTARHVTASVIPRVGNEYDFLVDTEHGSVRMLAPDWQSMQDWVHTLRTKLHELRILSAGENVYCVGRGTGAPPAPRAPARDPTSPLPPTPLTPPVRAPGIEPPTTRALRPLPPEPTPLTLPSQPPAIPPEAIDISQWADPNTSSPLPSTSQNDCQKNVKICGQNICLDDSVLKRNGASESDEEFFAEIDRISDGVDNMEFDGDSGNKYRQTVVVSNGEKCGSEEDGENSETQGPNITVIQVSNKDPPHTAIPIMGPKTNVFEFEFQQHLPAQIQTETSNSDSFVNIVNTESEATNGYGTVFTDDSEYGHVSLMTTVNVTDDNPSDVKVTDVKVTDVKVTDANVTDANVTDANVTDANVTGVNAVYERLCMASTSNGKSPLPLRKIKNQDKLRKSSLPNLEAVTAESPYEYLFTGNTASVVNSDNNEISDSSRSEVNRSDNPVSVQVNRAPIVNVNTSVLRTSNVERSFSHNEYDSTIRIRENVRRRVQNNSPKRDARIEREPAPGKPIWKRGLTELSFLSRLRGRQGKRHDSPNRQENDNDSSVQSAVKVVHRSRQEMRADNVRRRSSSLSNGAGPPLAPLQPLIVASAARLRSEQRLASAVPACLSTRDTPVVCEYNHYLWVCKWPGAPPPPPPRAAGDRLIAVNGVATHTRAHAAALAHTHTHTVDVLYHRVPLAKIYVINKKDKEPIGIKLDNECNITYVDAKCRIKMPAGKWALTQVNGRQLNLLKGTEDEMNRISLHGTEVSILIQPSPLVKKMRSAIKANHTLLPCK